MRVPPNPHIATLMRATLATLFSAATSLCEAATVLSPINALLYITVANRQAQPANIVGISFETSDNSWWPTWTKWCHVSLRGPSLVMARDPESVILMKAETFEIKAMASPIAPMQPIGGWTAW